VRECLRACVRALLRWIGSCRTRVPVYIRETCIRGGPKWRHLTDDPSSIDLERRSWDEREGTEWDIARKMRELVSFFSSFSRMTQREIDERDSQFLCNSRLNSPHDSSKLLFRKPHSEKRAHKFFRNLFYLVKETVIDTKWRSFARNIQNCPKREDVTRTNFRRIYLAILLVV